MSRLGGLAALAIGLVGAPVAAADSNDRAFIEATDKVISGVGPWVGPDGWVGYPKVPVQLRINTAHAVCALLDGGASSANDFIVAALDDRREHAGYLGRLVPADCHRALLPRHSDKLGVI